MVLTVYDACQRRGSLVYRLLHFVVGIVIDAEMKTMEEAVIVGFGAPVGALTVRIQLLLADKAAFRFRLERVFVHLFHAVAGRAEPFGSNTPFGYWYHPPSLHSPRRNGIARSKLLVIGPQKLYEETTP